MSSQTHGRNAVCDRRKTRGGEKGVGVSGRQTQKKGCLLADDGVWSCQSSSRDNLPAWHSETEAMYPMKYSPKLSLLKKEGRAGDGKMCCDRDGESPEISWCQLCTGFLARGCAWRIPAGGPLNVHINVPLTASQSPEKSPQSKTKYSANSAVLSKYPQHA